METNSKKYVIKEIIYVEFANGKRMYFDDTFYLPCDNPQPSQANSKHDSSLEGSETNG